MAGLKHTVCEKRTYGNKADTHEHSYYQLLLPLQGSLHLEINEQHQTLDDHSVLMLPPHCKHVFYAQGRNEFLVLDIPFLACSDESPVGKYVRLDERWEAIRFLLLNEVQYHEGPVHHQGVDHLLPYLSHLLQSRHESPSIQYIHDHYSEEISIQVLADLEHYHVAYYSQWFRDKMGMSPKAYIQSLRLKKAKQLLHSTNLTLLNIAQQVGYEYQSSLTRLFMQLEGVTPTMYRENITKLDK